MWPRSAAAPARSPPRRRRPADRRPAVRRRRPGAGLLRPGRRPRPPSPTPTSSSASCPPASPAARSRSTSRRRAARHRAGARPAARPLGRGRRRTGVRAVANANMVRAIRAVTVERGLDPRDLTLLAFGGSGPVHACDLAAHPRHRPRALPARRPASSPPWACWRAPSSTTSPRRSRGRLDRLDPCEVAARRAEMRAAAVAALARARATRPRPSPSPRPIDLRLEGQDAALSIPFAAFDRRGAAPGLPRRLPRDLRLCPDRRGRGRRAAPPRRGAHRRAARLPRAEAGRTATGAPRRAGAARPLRPGAAGRHAGHSRATR